MADQPLGGYDPNAGLSAHEAERPQLIPVPSLLRALLSEHLDPGYAAAAAKAQPRRRATAGAPRVFELGLASVGRVAGRHGVRRRRRAGPARSHPGVRAAQQLLVRSVRSDGGRYQPS